MTGVLPDAARVAGMRLSSFGHRARLWFALTLIVLLIACIAAFPLAERRFLISSAAQMDGALGLAASGLESEFRRFENVPRLLVRDPVLTELLAGNLDEAERGAVDGFLLEEARRIGAAELFVLDRAGIVRAASSHKGTGSFLGRDFSYRPYFVQSMEGRSGRFFALGQASGERGYYIASPVRNGDGIVGAVVLKVAFGSFETHWQLGEPEIAVSDPSGVLVMSSNQDWLFRTLGELPPAAISAIRETRQYPVAALRPLDIVRHSQDGALERMTIGAAGGATEFLIRMLPLGLEGWEIRIFVPTAQARTNALFAILAFAAACAFLSLLGFIFWQRRQAVREKIELQKRTEDMLVQRVEERTAMLTRAVGRLEEEVAQRRRTETELRETQEELVQSEKLAALGKTSASISHEFNQPLTALRNFAQNALTFMDRGMDDNARDAMTSVVETLKRLSRLSRQLQDFSRTPSKSVDVVPLRQAVDRALVLFEARLQDEGVHLDLTQLDDDLCLRADEVQLEHVIVNLIGNALDALEDRPDPRIKIAAQAREAMAIIRVVDNGPGIPAEMREKIFEPFHTTKSHGRGLGLGLAIARNAVRDFGGTLTAGNSPDGGAEFTISLQRVRQTAEHREDAPSP